MDLQSVTENDVVSAVSAMPASGGVAPQICDGCGGTVEVAGSGRIGAAPSYVYAFGQIEPRFPSQSVEKEFAQRAGRTDTKNLTDRQVLSTVLAKPENRYLVRELGWVLTIVGMDTYLLRPQDPRDFDLLVEAIRPIPTPMDLDLVVGMRGPLAPPELYGGLVLPLVSVQQIYSFDRSELTKAIPRPKGVVAKAFETAAAEVLDRLLQLTDNAGATDEHRAVNYLAARYSAIYFTAVEAFARGEALTAVDVRTSPLAGTRRVVDVIFSYTNRTTDVVQKFYVSVDVTEPFPFLVKKMSSYFDR